MSSQLHFFFQKLFRFFEKARIFTKTQKAEGALLKNADILKNLRRHQMLPVPEGA